MCTLTIENSRQVCATNTSASCAFPRCRAGLSRAQPSPWTYTAVSIGALLSTSSLDWKHADRSWVLVPLGPLLCSATCSLPLSPGHILTPMRISTVEFILFLCLLALINYYAIGNSPKTLSHHALAKTKPDEGLTKSARALYTLYNLSSLPSQPTRPHLGQLEHGIVS